MHRGFIRLWRKTADSQSASRGANHIAMMAWLLMQANWSEKFVNGIRIDRGQLLTSVAKLSAELRISVQSVRTVLHNLTTDGFLTIKSTNKYSVITICNFNTYQVDENTDQQTNQQTSNKQATNKQQQQYNNKNNKNNYNIYNNTVPNDADLQCKDLFRADESVFPFDEFWNAYGKKVDRAKCERMYAKIKEDDRAKIKTHVPKYVASTPDVQYRKNPQTYLNGKCWNDEIIAQQQNNWQNNTTKTNSYYKFDGNTPMQRNPEEEREDLRDF